MKKIIIFICLLIQTIVYSQESKGYVLDGTYMTGHVPYGNFIDTLDQPYTVSSTAKAIKFRKIVDSSAVTISADTIIKVLYSGLYKVDVEFRLDNPFASNSFGGYDIISTWVNMVDGTRLNNTTVSHIHHNISDIQTHRFTQVLKLNNNDEFKIMISMEDDQLTLTTTGAEASPPRPQQPSARIIIYKISDL